MLRTIKGQVIRPKMLREVQEQDELNQFAE